MENQQSLRPLTRREFIRRSGGAGIGLVGFSGFVPGFLARAAAADVPHPEKDRTILVLVQLAGGNDGLNTLVPHGDDAYYRLRPTLGIREGLHRLDGYHAFHPSCGPLAELFKEGQLSIVQNVGYPNPNRSHFRSMEIWETASGSDDYAKEGWLGRYFDNYCAGAPQGGDGPLAVHVGNETPQSLHASSPHSIFGMSGQPRGRRADGADTLRELVEATEAGGNAAYLEHAMLDALITEDKVERALAGYRTPTDYPGGRLSRALKNVAALIVSGMDTRIYYVSQGGYDTHAGQLGSHANNLRELSGALAAFQKDLIRHKLDKQVVTMTFSEFGRRPSENGSEGTDHGTAAPLFVLGTQLKERLCGMPPNLQVEENQDLTFSTDFRQVYATLLERWFEVPGAPVVGEGFKPLGFLG